MKGGEEAYWLMKEVEEANSGGGMCSNFLSLLSVPTPHKSARNLYPSLGNDDSDANGAWSNVIKTLEEIG